MQIAVRGHEKLQWQREIDPCFRANRPWLAPIGVCPTSFKVTCNKTRPQYLKKQLGAHYLGSMALLRLIKLQVAAPHVRACTDDVDNRRTVRALAIAVGSECSKSPNL